MAAVPDIVRLAKLDTQFDPVLECTRHTRSTPDTTIRRRVVRTEGWMKEKELGRGSFGVVWLERCTQGDKKGSLRAVKVVKKLPSSNYHRELEAFALFSYSQYEQCFVKSFGWYDNHDSIFIAMEYLPNGDLQEYLSAPLSEKEGQGIVSQILEELAFMHDAGFTHRDLKPANLLVVQKDPDWWVKITDFGISKRATEGLTVLQTVTGTPAFAAPEILGFFQPGDTPNDFYTNSVDIWSLGVIAYLVLTGETLFKDQRRLGQYVAGRFAFPSNVLFENNISEEGCAFVEILMAPKSELRPEAKECLQHPWLNQVTKASEVQRPPKIPKTSQPSIINIDPEPSTRSSTRVEASAPEMRDLTIRLAEDSVRKSRKKETPAKSGLAVGFYTGTLDGRTRYVKTIAFSPDGTQIASLGYGYINHKKLVEVWDTTTGKALGIFERHCNHNGLAFTENGKDVVFMSNNRTITFWDPITDMQRDTPIEYPETSKLSSSTLSSNGKQLVCGLDYNKIIFLDTATGVVCCTLNLDNSYLFQIVMSQDGEQIIYPSGASVGSGSSQSIEWPTRLWNKTTGESRMFDGLTIVCAISPSGKQIVSVSHPARMILWNSITMVKRREFRLRPDKSFDSVTFSADEKQIALGSEDGVVELWDISTGTCTVFVDEIVDRVVSVAFSPDGKLLASVSGGGMRRIWDSSLGLRVEPGEYEV